jgi:hypothetical protein
MASSLFINSFLQVQVDGLDLRWMAISDSPFGYYCTLFVVQSPLLSTCLKTQLAQRWYMQKGGRLKPDKDAND